jgi:hypothetical protein
MWKIIKMNNLYLIAAAGLTTILLLALFLWKTKGRIEPKDTDYRTFFIIGIAFFPIGIATGNAGLWSLGLIFMIIGAANKDKWSQ